jgi:hypothetical protein
MKHLLFSVLFLFMGLVTVSAQCNKSASKACCASKSAAASTTSAVSISDVDAVIAASNGSISKRMCEHSGTVSYFEKSVCTTSGKISWDEVQFDNEKKTFTKVASASMEKDENGVKVETKACAGKAEAKACCKKDSAKACAGTKQGSK